MPATMTLIGSVDRLGSGASTDAMIEVVATITVLLPPASACATARTTALRAASRSSVTSITGLAAGSAMTATGRILSPRKAASCSGYGARRLRRPCRSEVHGVVVADHHR